MARSVKRADGGAKPSEQATDDSMGYLVRRTFRAFTRSLEQRLNEHDVSISMWFFLRLLWEQDGITQKDLSLALGLSQPTTVSAIDNLERRGLVRRYRNVEDRRKVNVHLTKAGKNLRGNLIGYAHEVNAIGISDLSKAEVETLRDLLLRVNAALDREYESSMASAKKGD